MPRCLGLWSKAQGWPLGERGQIFDQGLYNSKKILCFCPSCLSWGVSRFHDCWAIKLILWTKYMIRGIQIVYQYFTCHGTRVEIGVQKGAKSQSHYSLNFKNNGSITTILPELTNADFFLEGQGQDRISNHWNKHQGYGFSPSISRRRHRVRSCGPVPYGTWMIPVLLGSDSAKVSAEVTLHKEKKISMERGLTDPHKNWSPIVDHKHNCWVLSKSFI